MDGRLLFRWFAPSHRMLRKCKSKQGTDFAHRYTLGKLLLVMIQQTVWDEGSAVTERQGVLGK